MNFLPRPVSFNQPEWVEIPSVIKLTLQNLTQAVQQTGKILNQELQNKVRNKGELINLREVKEELANRVSFQDLNNSLAPFNSMLRGKASFQDLKAVEMRVDLSGDLEQLRQEFMRRWQDTASQSDLEYIKRSLQLKANLHQTKKSLNEKANKVETQNAMAKKANKEETETFLAGKAEKRELSQLQAALQVKIDHFTFEQFRSSVVGNFQELKFSLTKLIDSREYSMLKKVNGRLEKIEKRMFQIGKELEGVKFIPQIQADLQTKLASKDHNNIVQDLKTELESIKKIIKNQISNWESLTKQIQSLKNENQKNYRNFGNQLVQTNQSLEQKFLQIYTALQTNKDFLQKKQQNLGENFRQLQIALTQNQRKILDLLQQKAQKTELKLIQQSYCKQEDLLQINKQFEASHLRFSEQIQRKIADLQSETYQISNIKSEISQLKLQIDQKSNYSQAKSQFTQISKHLQLLSQKSVSLQHLIQTKSSFCVHDTYIDQLKLWQVQFKASLQQKANLFQIQDFLNAKADFKQINESLQNLQEQLEKKVQVSDFDNRFSEQTYINQILCKENYVGRWVWKSGHSLKGIVKWDTETVNTYPEGLQWISGATSVTLLVPGIYQVIFGFYSRKEPHVSLILNSEVAHSYPAKLPKKSAQVTQGKSGNEFVAVAVRSRISFKILNDAQTEGFFGIKKLQEIIVVREGSLKLFF